MATIRETVKKNRTKIELMVDDQAVSNLTIVDLDVRIGDCVLRCGGYAGVHTEREQQMKGYGRQIIEEGIIYMREQGYHLSALFGIPDFYHRFGYAPALVECEAKIATRDAELAPKRYTVREIDPHEDEGRDASAMAEMYAQLNKNRTGTVVRNEKTWYGYHLGANWGSRISAYLVCDGDEILGYAVYNQVPRAFVLAEMGYTAHDVFGTILAEAAERAWTKRVEHIILHMPPDDPFLAYCQAYGCEIKLTYNRNADGMARIINQSETLAEIAPMLRRRLEAAASVDAVGQLMFVTDLGKDQVGLGTGPDRCIEVSQSVLTQWIMGFVNPATSAIRHGLTMDENDLVLLEMLFPVTQPYMHWADHF